MTPVPDQVTNRHVMSKPHSIQDKNGIRIDIPRQSVILLMRETKSKGYRLTFNGVTYALDSANGSELACD